MKTLNRISALLIVLLLSPALLADGDKKQSIKPSDIMWKKEVIRALDLREKQNRPLFSANQQITKYLIEGVKTGMITAYTSDSLTTALTSAEFMKKIEIETGEEPDTAYMEDWEKEEYLNSVMNRGPEYYFPQDFYQMEMKEDLVFDKSRSQMKYDIKTLTFFLPADHPENIRGIQSQIASFDYKQLEEFFASHPNALWYNPSNDGEHRNLADAFELRLFSSYIIKVSNPNDEYLSDIYGGEDAGIMASYRKSHELLEFEHNLWEY